MGLWIYLWRKWKNTVIQKWWIHYKGNSTLKRFGCSSNTYFTILKSWWRFTKIETFKHWLYFIINSSLLNYLFFFIFFFIVSIDFHHLLPYLYMYVEKVKTEEKYIWWFVYLPTRFDFNLSFNVKVFYRNHFSRRKIMIDFDSIRSLHQGL